MNFKVLPVDSDLKNEPINTVYLLNDNWNDWYKYKTMFQVFYKKYNDESVYIGSVKIGDTKMNFEEKTPDIPRDFSYLTNNFFSLGQDSFYYENLNRLGDEFREEFLRKLNDISFNLKIFEEIKELPISTRSIMRSVKEKIIREQFHSLAHGISELIQYKFKFCFDNNTNKDDFNNDHELFFESNPDSNPPTNVQAIIGRNGVGKTFLLNRMVKALIGSEEEKKESGKFHNLLSKNEPIFDNIIYLSFSAFDDGKFFYPNNRTEEDSKYTYIGLKRINNDDKNSIETKSTEQLKNELIDGMWQCRKIETKRNRLNQAIQMLNADPIFSISGISDLLNFTEKELKAEKTNFKEFKTDFFDNAELICRKLSSGHSIVLITITRLIQKLEERTLVLLDEPESHLHPPLLSTLIRILSNLLVNRNGIGIIATHSPVIIQEIPKKCVWIADRIGSDFLFERPEIETFGENINSITKGIFSFEVTDSGFHNLLKEVSIKSNSYEEAVNVFNGELGMEARAILRSLIDLKGRE